MAESVNVRMAKVPDELTSREIRALFQSVLDDLIDVRTQFNQLRTDHNTLAAQYSQLRTDYNAATTPTTATAVSATTAVAVALNTTA